MDISSLKDLFAESKKYFSLQVEYAKLTALEKMTVLLSTAAFVGVLIVLFACLLFFISAALVALLESWIGCEWAANLIVVGFILILILLIVALKKRFIIDPVSKFITKLFMNPPEN